MLRESFVSDQAQVMQERRVIEIHVAVLA